ncbi:MAG TPA: hypothetical protein VLM40_07045 [Gemmata sp.]|nr:hypothetical protein [Gemmata sp.]
MSTTEFELDLGTLKMHCPSEEVAAGFACLLREMQFVVRVLRADERVALRLIMSRPSGSLRVCDVFRDFARESESHKTLRRLRAAQFIRPAETGAWTREEPITVKEFARMLWERLGEGEIFARDPEEVELGLEQEPPAAQPAEPPPAAVETEKTAFAEQAIASSEPEDVEKVAARMWEDDAVVDLADVDDLRQCVEHELRQNH